MWLFEDFASGGKALFNTEVEAQTFRHKLDIELLKDPEIGEALGPDDYKIQYVEINPDFKTWWNTP